MKTQSISLFPSIVSTTAVIFSICASMLLFVGQTSAAEISASNTLDGSELAQANTVSNKSSSAPDQATGLVNLNTAGASVLSDGLKGIGLKKAQAIVDWRKANGEFVRLEQLLEVKGIGEKILLLNRHKMRL